MLFAPFLAYGLNILTSKPLALISSRTPSSSRASSLNEIWEYLKKTWIKGNSDDDFILKQCSPRNFFFTMLLELLKEEVEFNSCTEAISNWKILKNRYL